jgi:hypothetical protein
MQNRFLCWPTLVMKGDPAIGKFDFPAACRHSPVESLEGAA